MIIKTTDWVYNYDEIKDTMTKIEPPMIPGEYTWTPIKFTWWKLEWKFARIIKNDEWSFCIKDLKQKIPRTFLDYILFRTRYEFIEGWINIK